METATGRGLARAVDSFPLLRLLRQGSSRFTIGLLLFVLLSGLTNALLLAIINVAGENASNAAANGRYLWMFVIVLVAFILTQRYILLTSVIEVERILHRIRVTITDRIRRADPYELERIGRSEIYASVNRETVTISQVTSTLITACQSMLMILFSMLYLAWLSLPAFWLTVAITLVGLLMHFRKGAEYNARLQDAATRENQFFDRLTDLIEGFKEVKLNEPRGTALLERLRAMSQTLAGVKIGSGTSFIEHYVFAQAAFYILIGSIVFLLPQFAPTFPTVVLKATAAELFIIGPLSSVVGAIPVFARANVAAENIATLERALDRSAGPDGSPLTPRGSPVTPRPAGAFTEIALRQVEFQYDDGRGGASFSIGPIDFSLRSGELVFIMGGNGSGKSTFLKVLTGLYHPRGGVISVDRAAVGPGEASWYRSHFSAVFSDYHLFDELFGLENVATERVEELLRQMKLDQKTGLVNGRFTTVDLSTGQRKRLAFIVSVLEDRPIMVFDEWAADQDPSFRRFFYQEVLPSLRRQGKTLVVVTHDDRYFSTADRVLQMDYGQLVEYSV